MCWVIDYQNCDKDVVSVCYFHDKETAEKVLDHLEIKDFSVDYELHQVPLSYVKEYKVPYCQNVLEELGVVLV